VDLLLLHWPQSDVPLAERIGGLNEVHDAGKVRHIGVSNFNTALMAESVALSKATIVTNQVEYHPYLDQTAVLNAARKFGMSITAYYAMADGKVIGDPTIKAIAAAHGKSEAQVVLRWLVQQDGVVALSKTVGEERAMSNFQIFDFELSSNEMRALHALARPDGRIVNPRNLAPEWD
jgi:2,5-diketo-D-gluconate reductase B